jgi:hypothetical protein
VTETKLVTREELLELLAATGLNPTTQPGLYDAPTTQAIVDAQFVLLEHGFYLSDVSMVEGHFYMMTFAHMNANIIDWVSLRYVTSNGMSLPVTLMYRSDGEMVRLEPHGYTHGTGTSEAEKMEARFSRELGNRPYFWVPVLEGSPIASY